MGTLTKTFTFTPGTGAVASQVNADLDTLYGWVNSSAIWADASTAFTGVPSGPNTDPTSGNQYTRKTYVDDHLGGQQMRFGVFIGTTDSNGTFLAPFSPVFPTQFTWGIAFSLTHPATGAYVCRSIAANTSQWQVGVCNSQTGANIANTSLTVAWIATGL